MNGLYRMKGISKQAHLKAAAREDRRSELREDVLRKAAEIRRDHRRAGMETLYHSIRPRGMGRDACIELLRENGFRLRKKRNFTRTTRSHPYNNCPNLIHRMELTGVNQLWVSDITYIPLGRGHCYLTLILDVYSRKIIGWSLDTTLQARSNVRALRMALKTRSGQDLSGTVHHSDRGSQYKARKYAKILKDKGIRRSMGNKAWENAHAEKINDTIKNGYILPRKPRTWKQVQKATKRAVHLYNYDRPHQALERKTPVEFEKMTAGLAPHMRQKYLINY